MSLNAPEKVKRNACGIYKIIAEAEGKVHGREPGEVHFHEVGAMDAVADVMAVCLLIDELSPQMIISSPLNTGHGTVKCAHGILPVPAPATAEILKGLPSYNDEIEGELLTPTGAALIKFFADEFGSMPVMKTESVGYGLGRKKFARLNAVRTFLGETAQEEDSIVELTVNLDDMDPERIGFVWGKLLDLGAADVFSVPIYMKKQRPAVMLKVLVTEEKKDDIVQALFRYTTTIGIRENRLKRFVLKREIREVPTRFGVVRKKISRGYGVKREKYEYEDLAEIALREGLTIDEVSSMVEEDDDEK
ncbi:MAG: nickel pincer cofactor biosynthesis protein LarC, partial [Firmicutes bacterium]|nr:nickel pincer cofactor biosynthesis protein LarC [Bacillota bacterium]